MRTSVAAASVALAGALGALAVAGSPVVLAGQATPVVAIRNVSVIPMDAPGILAARTVVVAGGAIQTIGPVADVRIPVGARVLDGTGRYMVPGFADMHAHLWRQATLDLMLAHGITVARDMNAYPQFTTWRWEIERGVRVGPRLVLASRIFEGTPPPEHADVIITEGRVIVDDSAAAADSVLAHVTRGVNAIKVYNNLNAAAYRGITVRARQLDVPVVGHVPFSVGLAGVFGAGQRSIEHLRGYLPASWPAGASDPPGADFRSRLVNWRRTDTIRLRALATETAQRGIWNVPTLATNLDLLPVARIGELTARRGWQQCMRGARADPVASRARIPYFAVMSDADFTATQAGVVVQKQLVRMLHEAGAGLLVGTDRLPWGYSFHWELEELVSAGLAPWDVLYAATLGAARFLGQDSTHGSLTPGKAAEFVLLDANPLDDIRNARRISAVFAGGRLLEAAALDSLRTSGCNELSR